MRVLLIISTFCAVALAGTFEIVDVNGICYIYTNCVWGCTGSSKPIGHLNGSSCSDPDLSVQENGNWVHRNVVNVTACDSDHGQAYFLADRTGLLIFHNTAGNTANCTVGADFHAGSICTAVDDGPPAQSTPVVSPTGKPAEAPPPSQSFAASMQTDIQTPPATTLASNSTAPQTPDSIRTETDTTDC
ncbi:hypothetical protein N7540_010982 [Penicillium herquei]|nr:hypothetical protein N7540_010982 [Penicillium herquei]